VAVTDDLDLLETRRVDQEGPFYAHATGDPADRDLGVEAAAANAQNGALIRLESLAVAFDDAHG
jgi:hypothetical protein